MIFYFSGTGNSRWVAERLGELLGESVYSIADMLVREDTFTASEDRLGLVFPVYSWGPPAVVLEFIANLYSVCTPNIYILFVLVEMIPEKLLNLSAVLLRRKDGSVMLAFLL